jgi:hypothetical protein
MLLEHRNVIVYGGGRLGRRSHDRDLRQYHLRRNPRLARASITTAPGSEHHELSAKGSGG